MKKIYMKPLTEVEGMESEQMLVESHVGIASENYDGGTMTIADKDEDFDFDEDLW